MLASSSTINKSLLIFILGILAALGPFSIDMYLPGFQKIAQEFITTESKVAFTLTSYFFGIAIGQLIYGPLVDRYGRKRPLIIGLLIYVLAAIGCGMSNSIEMLIIMRLIQALGGCVGMVASSAIISDVYERAEMAKAFSSLVLVMGIAPIIAPTIGGLVITAYSWRFIFYALSIFAILLIIMLVFTLPETRKPDKSVSLLPSRIIMGYKEIMVNKQFILYTLVASISMSVLFIFISSASVIYQVNYLVDERTFGIIFGINAFGFISGSFTNSRLLNIYSMPALTKFAATIICVFAALLLITVTIFPKPPYAVFSVAFFIMLFFTGFVSPNASAGYLAPFKHNSGYASALAGAIRMGMGAVVAAIVGLIHTHFFISMAAVIVLLTAVTLCLLIWAIKVESSTGK